MWCMHFLCTVYRKQISQREAKVRCDACVTFFIRYSAHYCISHTDLKARSQSKVWWMSYILSDTAPPTTYCIQIWKRKSQSKVWCMCYIFLSDTARSFTYRIQIWKRKAKVRCDACVTFLNFKFQISTPHSPPYLLLYVIYGPLLLHSQPYRAMLYGHTYITIVILISRQVVNKLLFIYLT
jgi:hypothetical protein